MNRESERVVVFSDGAGDLYWLPAGVLEAARVPEQYQDEVRQRLGKGDTGGFLLPAVSSLSVVGVLSGSDRMGNFEIQNLMSQYNQSETLGAQQKQKQ